MHISVCICSYQRPLLLKRTLSALQTQKTENLFSYSVVICDNDSDESGKAVANEFSKAFESAVHYCVESRRSISHARNKALEFANGDLVAFIDDDEFPEKDWLLNLYQTLTRFQVAGVLGPVKPHFDEKPPEWIIKGRFCERPEHPTGFLMPWSECRTGNVLFKKEILVGLNPIFRPEFGSGGGDVNFFLRMMQAGHQFVWCNEAVVHEVVPPSRCKRSFMLKRALLRGSNLMKQPKGRISGVLKSALAVPIYTLMLPLLPVFGHHWFMKYLIKWCDHCGRLLAIFNLRLVKKREM